MKTNKTTLTLNRVIKPNISKVAINSYRVRVKRNGKLHEIYKTSLKDAIAWRNAIIKKYG